MLKKITIKQKNTNDNYFMIELITLLRDKLSTIESINESNAKKCLKIVLSIS